MNLEVSILIVSFNTRELLKKCLQNVVERSNDILKEIIVVDNGSNDGSADMTASEFPDVLLIRNKENLGFGAANNVGYQASKGKYIVLLNSDAFLYPHALQLALSHIQANPSIGLGG